MNKNLGHKFIILILGHKTGHAEIPTPSKEPILHVPQIQPEKLMAAPLAYKCANRKNSSQNDSILDADSSSTKSGRRPSVDTVSTYLSHESKDSTTQLWHGITSVSDFLDCSFGSDEVFDSTPQHSSTTSIVGKKINKNVYWYTLESRF